MKIGIVLEEKLVSSGNHDFAKVDVLTTEILILKHQTENNLIEIGKRLITVKESLPHGEWGKWLSEKVDFTDRTAQRLMKVANEFSNTTALSHLSRSKVFALLELPREEREEFINSNSIDDMSTRQLQQVIKEKKELENKLSEAEEAKTKAESDSEEAKKKAEAEHLAWQSISDSYQKLEKTNNEHYVRAESLRKELEVAKTTGSNDEIERLQKSLELQINELNSSQKKIEDLERQLKENPIEVTAAPVVERIPEEVEKELQLLRKKNQQSSAVVNFSVNFKSLVKGFEDLLGSLAEIKKTDTEEHEKYKNAVVGLINKMTESL